MNNIEKLQELIDEIDVLIGNQATIKDNNFRTWKDSLIYFLKKNFGKESDEYNSITSLDFGRILSFDNAYFVKHPHYEFVKSCREDLERCKNYLNLYLSTLQEIEETKEEENNLMKSRKETKLSYEEVFIVHGHNGELKEKVARLIEKQDIDAIILDEQANQGRTIIEKIEEYSDVGGAICLFTADDVGEKKSDEGEGQFRARQNVVFETGYFMGKLGRDHVVIIAEHEMEFPSDLSGIVFTNKDKWEIDVLKELKAMGYPIDMNKLFE